MAERNYIDIREIEELYRKLGISEEDIASTPRIDNERFLYEERDMFSKRWDSSFFANARY